MPVYVGNSSDLTEDRRAGYTSRQAVSHSLNCSDKEQSLNTIVDIQFSYLKSDIKIRYKS